MAYQLCLEDVLETLGYYLRFLSVRRPVARVGNRLLMQGNAGTWPVTSRAKRHRKDRPRRLLTTIDTLRNLKGKMK